MYTDISKRRTDKTSAFFNSAITTEPETELELPANQLKFGKGNAKLSVEIGTFSLPAGTTCPFARLCKTGVAYIKDEATPDGKPRTRLVRYPLSSKPEDELVDDRLRFRCFAASFEALYPSYRRMVASNKRILTEVCKNDRRLMHKALCRSIDKLPYKKFRIHVGGDFFSEAYFLAWCDTANSYSGKTFYSYTKSLPYWVKHIDEVPSNLILTASRGGIHDDLIGQYDLKNVQVYFHPDLAKADNVEIDHDDSLALDPTVKKFGLLLHGNQDKDSNAARYIAKMRREHIQFGYPRSRKHTAASSIES